MLSLEGSKGKIISTFKENYKLSTVDAEKIFEYIEKNMDILDKDEFLKKEVEIPITKPGMMSFIIPSTKYYLNIKRATITLVATICDIHITKGILNGVLTIGGINLKAITKLKGAELCMTKEIIRCKNHTATVDLLYKEDNECINNDIDCEFNQLSNCVIKKCEIKTILYNLESKNVLKKNGSLYKYQL